MEQLKEDIKTIRNLCDIASLILEQHVDKRQTLLPAILEQMFLNIQDVVDEHCVVREDNDNEADRS